MWRTKNTSSETEIRGPERVNLTKWRRERREPLRECQEDGRTFLQQPFQGGTWEVLGLDVDV